MRLAVNRAGVTLIELVVGLTIASALFAAGYAALTTAIDRREQAVTLLDSDLAATSVRASLRQWLSGAQTVPESSGALISGIDAETEGLPDDQLSFLTSAETPLGPGPATVRLYIDRDPDTPERGLVAAFTAWLGTARTRVQLAPQAAALEIRYRSDLVGGRDWLPSWISSSVMPAALEMHISAVDGEALHPLLEYPMRVAIHGGR